MGLLGLRLLPPLLQAGLQAVALRECLPAAAAAAAAAAWAAVPWA